MRNLLTNEQMRSVDAFAMRKVSGLELMERAGEAVFERVKKLLEGVPGTVVCVCGGGNNGGDGFVVARFLLMNGYGVKVVCRAERFSEETRINREKYFSLGGEILENMPNGKISLIVDCLLGTGFSGELRPDALSLVELVNTQKTLGAYVVSVDIPSGICGDNGLGDAFVHADETLCVGEEKLGVRLLNGLDGAGEIYTLDIGLNGFEDVDYVKFIEKEDIKKLFKKRGVNLIW